VAPARRPRPGQVKEPVIRHDPAAGQATELNKALGSAYALAGTGAWAARPGVARERFEKSLGAADALLVAREGVPRGSPAVGAARLDAEACAAAVPVGAHAASTAAATAQAR
jgi:hypothetical protein